MEAEKALKEQKEMEEVAKQLKKAMKGMGIKLNNTKLKKNITN